MKESKNNIEAETLIENLTEVMISEDKQKIQKRLKEISKQMKELVNLIINVDNENELKIELNAYVNKKYKKLVNAFSNISKIETFNEYDINSALGSLLYDYDQNRIFMFRYKFSQNDSLPYMTFDICRKEFMQFNIISKINKFAQEYIKLYKENNQLLQELNHYPQSIGKFSLGANVVKKILKTSEEGKVFFKQVEEAYKKAKTLSEKK